MSSFSCLRVRSISFESSLNVCSPTEVFADAFNSSYCVVICSKRLLIQEDATYIVFI